MPLPSSGPISLLDLKNEFGGVTPISLRDYYSGGKYVPANTVGALGVIPSSGPLSLKHFRGAQLVKNYVFTPVYNYSDGGTAYASNGVPADYNASTYGNVIWPAGKGEGSAGWVGTKITPLTNSITLLFTCDNSSSIYVDSKLVLSTNDWRSWHSATVTVVPNIPVAISAFVSDAGGARGFAGRIMDGNGTVLARTSAAWVSS